MNHRGLRHIETRADRTKRLLAPIQERVRRTQPDHPRAPEAVHEATQTPTEPEPPESWFPYPDLRPVQSRFLTETRKAYLARKHVVAHLPTGVGKTSVALAAVLSTPLTLLYLTNRQTQHDIVVKELEALARNKGKHVGYVDLISKQAMCVNEDVSHERVGRGMRPVDYSRFGIRCQGLVKAKACSFKNAVDAEPEPPPSMSALEMVDLGRAHGQCPYYLATKRLPVSRVLIADYNVLIAGQLDARLDQLEVPLSHCAVVIDEAHNLASRVRDLYARVLTVRQIEGALVGIAGRDAGASKILTDVKERLRAVFERLPPGKAGERVVEIAELMPSGFGSIDELRPALRGLEDLANRLHAASKGDVELPLRVMRFLMRWFAGVPQARIARRKGEKDPRLHIKLIDPAPVTRDLLTGASWSLLMSGTLHPPQDFAAELGFKPEEFVALTEPSPFPKENRRVRFYDSLTTKFSGRSEDLYERYAELIRESLRTGANAAIFVPSYDFGWKLKRHLPDEWRLIAETPGMTKEDRDTILAEMRRSKSTGSVLLAVFGGGFSEGVDFPNGLLPQIFLVGLPLAPWNLEVKEFLRYYQGRLGNGKGEEVAYNLPAVTRAVQAAGRGIRGPTDVCDVHFVDARFLESKYLGLLPPEYLEAARA